METKNAPNLAKYDSDHFGPENRPCLNFNFKGGLFSAPNGSDAYLARYAVFVGFSKLIQLIVQPRDPYFSWQAWQTLYHTVASLNLLIEKTNFAFYSIKTRLETPEMIPTLGTW